MRNSNLRLWGNAAAISGVLVTVLALADRHHASDKLSVQVAAAVFVWLALTVAGVLATLWGRGHRPAGRSRIALSLAVSLDLCVPVALYPRHPNTRPVAARVIGGAIDVLLCAVLIWATIWGAVWLLRRARPAGARGRKVLGAWVISLAVAGALSVIRALRNTGFDSHHVVLLVGVSVFLWLAIALALGVLLTLVGSTYRHIRSPLST